MTAHIQHITLSELQRRIKQAVESSLPLPVWIVAEISELKVNYSGHCYLELVEKSSPDSTEGARGTKSSTPLPTAQARAVIWRSQYQMIAAYFRASTGRTLEAGMQILAKVTVNYHELYGLSLQISDIDPTYTLGEVEREKQRTIEQLKADGVWNMNRELELPLPVQRIAVVSSATAAGYRDFMQELKAGSYPLRTTLFEAVMQGQAAEASVCDALMQVAQRADEFDVVVIIRGGGSANDLSCFNSYRLCSYVAQFPLPIITGIGHDKDTSVADMVAHTPLKTPTAVAAWLLEGLATTDAWLDEAQIALANHVTALLQHEQLALERTRELLRHTASSLQQSARMRLEMTAAELKSHLRLFLENRRSALTSAEAVIEASDPKRVLAMGFAVVRCDGHAVMSAEGLKGRRVEIELHDGTIEAEIEK